jgi:hypothetical protein
VLTVCAQAEILVWRGFWRVSHVEKLRKALEKKALQFRGIKARKSGRVNPSATFSFAS